MNTPSPVNTPSPTPAPIMESPKKTQLGPVIGLIIILAIIVVGTLYFWGQRVENTQVPQDTVMQTDQTGQTDTQTEQLQTQSSSDDITSIEADLNATDFGNIDSGSEQLQ